MINSLENSLKQKSMYKVLTPSSNPRINSYALMGILWAQMGAMGV